MIKIKLYTYKREDVITYRKYDELPIFDNNGDTNIKARLALKNRFRRKISGVTDCFQSLSQRYHLLSEVL